MLLKRSLIVVAAFTVLAPVLSCQAMLLAHWPFDDPAGTGVFETVQGITETVVGPDVRVPGPFGTALQCNGISTYIDTAVNQSQWNYLTSFTVTCWLRTATGQTTFVPIVDQHNAGISMGLFVGLSTSNGSHIAIGNGTTWQPLYGPNLVPGVWTHCAFVFDAAAINGELICYLDGVPVVTTNIPGGPMLDPRGSIQMRIGARAGGGGFLNADLDDLAIYDGALSAASVLNIMAGGVQPGAPQYQTNSLASSLDLDGVQGMPFSPAITTACVGATVMLNSTAPVGNPSDIAITFTNSVPAYFTTAAGQLVNVDIAHPSIFSFNGGAPTLAGVLNPMPHPGAFSFLVPTGSLLLASAQQLTVDPGHADGFELSQPVEANISAATTLNLTLGDDATTQVFLQTAQLCATSVDFYGTTYTDFHVNSNGDVGFTMGSTDFTATAVEWQTQMPRIGFLGDLEPNNYGTITVTNNGSVGLGSWMTIAYANVTEWGTGGLGVTSYNIELHGPNGHEVGGFTTDGTWGATATVAGISLGAAGTHPALVSFDTLNGLGLQPNINVTDSVIDENPGGMLPNTSAWTSIQFPFGDGSAYIVQ